MSDNKKRKGRYPYYRNNKNKGANSEKGGSKDNAPYAKYSTCIELEKAVEENLSEEVLAQAVAIAWNKYAWYGEKEASLTETDEKYTEMCENADSWFTEYEKLTERIKTFYGLGVDATFALPEISALMNKYNYSDDDGIWRKKNNNKNA